MTDSFGSHRDIINAWPSLISFAEDVGISYGSAKAMRRRDRIGHEHVTATVAAAAKRGIAGVSAELIARLVAKPAPVEQADSQNALNAGPTP